MSLRNRPWRVLSLPLLLAITMTAASFASADAAPGDPSAPPRELRAMTNNIHHGAGIDGQLDLGRIAAAIRAEDPDVVALQEVDRFWARSGFVDQPAELPGLLGLPHTCYGANLALAPDPGSTAPREYGTLILSRFPLLSCANAPLPNAGGEQRGLLEALLVVRGVPVRVFNTHLQHNAPNAAAGQAMRTAQVAAIAARLDAVEGPRLLLGDLSAAPADSELAPLAARLADAWPAGGAGPGYTIPAESPTRRIDYVFASRDIAVNGAAVPQTALTGVASDHLPVVANLALPGGEVGVGGGR